MMTHPGETAVDFAKTMTLMNTGETFRGIGQDMAEAASGEADAWARWAGGVGAGAKLSGWLLAVGGVLYVLSWLTGIGELATIAAFMGAMLASTIVLSGVEYELRIQAAAEAQSGRMAGLDKAIKTEASLARKIGDRVRGRVVEEQGLEKAVEASASRINDALRFTMILDPANYVAGGIPFVIVVGHSRGRFDHIHRSKDGAAQMQLGRVHKRIGVKPVEGRVGDAEQPEGPQWTGFDRIRDGIRVAVPGAFPVGLDIIIVAKIRIGKAEGVLKHPREEIVEHHKKIADPIDLVGHPGDRAAQGKSAGKQRIVAFNQHLGDRGAL
jgi:hypothetical protein